MSREMTVIAIGIWIIVLPHLGVPGNWHLILNTLTGLVLIAMGLYLRAVMLSGGARRTTHHPFVESSADAEHNNHHDHHEGKPQVN